MTEPPPPPHIPKIGLKDSHPTVKVVNMTSTMACIGCRYGIVTNICIGGYPLPCECELSLSLSLSLPFLPLPPSLYACIESCAVLVRTLKDLYSLNPSLPGRSPTETAK